MPVLDHRKSGDWDLWVINAGLVRMDGGAIFGVVPKPLWEKKLEPDERNRVTLNMNCLLGRRGEDVVLVETGFGGKVSDKMRDIYGLDESDGLEASLSMLGVSCESVTDVVLTHLHQDHAGGTTAKTDTGYRPMFPNATYHIQRGEWDDAAQADGQTRNGYLLEEVVEPLRQSGLIHWHDGDGEVCDGVQVLLTPGHTRKHQSVLLEAGQETFFFTGDLIPTTHHLRPVYVTAYDLYPRETYVNKQLMMARASADGWVVIWAHDPDCVWGRLRRDDEGYFEAQSL